MAWPAGTDATTEVKEVLRNYLRAQFAIDPIKSRLPARKRVVFAAPKSTQREPGQIRVLFYSGADETLPHEYESTAGRVFEEYHRVTMDVQADEKGAQADEAVKVASLIRLLFASPTHRQALIALGVFNVRESAEAVEMDGVEFKRPVNVTCSTAVLI